MKYGWSFSRWWRLMTSHEISGLGGLHCMHMTWLQPLRAWLRSGRKRSEDLEYRARCHPDHDPWWSMMIHDDPWRQDASAEARDPKFGTFDDFPIFQATCEEHQENITRPYNIRMPQQPDPGAPQRCASLPMKTPTGGTTAEMSWLFSGETLKMGVMCMCLSAYRRSCPMLSLNLLVNHHFPIDSDTFHYFPRGITVYYQVLLIFRHECSFLSQQAPGLVRAFCNHQGASGTLDMDSDLGCA